MRRVGGKSAFVSTQFRVGLCLTLGLSGLAWLAPAQGAGADSGPVTLFDSSTTGPGFFSPAATVPADICFVTITADGGHGGNVFRYSEIAAAGGTGARAAARVPVTPGDVLSAQVGGAGGVPNSGDFYVQGGVGGVGGGAGGGTVNGESGGGGGASAVSSASAPVLVVAGGGGGAGYGRAAGGGGLPTGGDGIGLGAGSGGLATGVGGAGAAPLAGYSTQGGGGGVSSGGDARGGNGTGINAIPSVGGGGGGGNSNFETGGAGGDAGSTGTGQGGAHGPGDRTGGVGGAGNTSGGNGGAGGGEATAGGGGGGIGFGGGGSGSAGGGGGGYGGGGGGTSGGSGGGGSSHVISTATSSSYAASTRSGDGQVTISYDPATDMCPPTQITVNVQGSQTFGSSSPVFTETDDAPSGVLSGTVSCTTVNSGTAITSSLPANGSYTIDGSSCSGLSASGNYTVSYVGGTYSVVPPVEQTQSIAFAALANKLYGATPFVVSASATSGLPVSFSSSTTTVCTVSGATVTIKTAGVCTIRASQAGDGSWAAATPVDRSFTVGYGIASLFPPRSTRFERGSTIPVVFALTGANGKQIPSAVASKLGCTVKVSFNGGSPICATWIPIVNVSGATIRTPRTLTRGQSYPIVVTVTVGATTVATATTTVVAK